MTAPAAVLLDDTWADGTRTNTSLPTDAAWYASSAASLVAATNSLTGTPSATASRTWWIYFTTNTASPVSLNVGDTLKVTLAFTPSGVAAQNGNFGLRAGLFNYSGGTRTTTDTVAAGAGVRGYLASVNFGSTLTNRPLEIMERTNIASASVMAFPADYSSLGAGGGGTGAPGFNSGAPYTLELSAKRNADSVAITAKFSDTNGWSISQTGTDISGVTSNFDAFFIRAATAGQTATSFKFTEIKVEVLSSASVVASVLTIVPPGETASIIFSGTEGVAYEVQRAVNVTNWTTLLTTNAPPGGQFQVTDNFSDLGSTPVRAFYRLHPLIPAAPTITTPPQSLTAATGQSATFTVTATGDAPLAYQWYFKTWPIANATNVTLALNNLTTNNAGNYAVLVANGGGSIVSAPATLTVLITPFITNQPKNQVVFETLNAAFSVGASGSAPLSYQWYFNTVPLANATNPSLSIVNAQFTNAGAYTVVITNAAGSVTSTVATLTVTNTPPVITVQPKDLFGVTNQSATFSVTASGSPPLRYQWYFNTNTPLPDATNASFTIASAQTNDAGGYSVVVTNGLGAATSIVATLSFDLPLVPGAFYVSLSGNDANPGTIDNPFLTIARGLNAIPNGGVVYLRGGTYAVSSKLNLSRTSASVTNTFRLWAYPGETPVLDGTGNTSDGIAISGTLYHLKGLLQRYAGHNGINISGHSNIVEFCTTLANTNTGLHITGGQNGTTFPSYNLILNCDSVLNFDGPIGGNSDGFSAKWDLGPGNVFRGCRAWWNSDDGWDLWMGSSPILIEDCWAFYNGTNYWSIPPSTFAGNGNGFKLGGNYTGTPHRLVRSVAFRNMAHGVDQNNNTAGQTVDNNTCWANVMKNFNLNHNTTNAPMSGNHLVRNNLSIGGGSADSFWPGTIFSNNSWQVISPAASNSDLQSVDESVATAPRQADGSLPVWPFLRLVPGGRLVDQGVDIGEPYSGPAPDLGAFETAP